MIVVAGCGKQEEQVAMPPPLQVSIANPLQKKIIEWDYYTGRFQATERVEVRARVSGYIEQINFKDGQMVNVGDVLFVIDQRPFKIELEQANANLKQAQAELKQAENDFDRAKRLREKMAVSEEEFDQRQQTMRAIAARVESAQAAVNQAKLNLEFTEVKAPIDGRVSRDLVTLGNLISGGTQDATLLTTIVSLSPIHFYFEASESDLLKYLRMNKSGERKASRDVATPVYVKLLDEEGFVHEGKMDFVDNEVDLSTGTMEGRALFENEDHFIEPGMFGRARLPGSGEYEAILIPDTVIGTDQSNKFVYVVKNDNTVEARLVKLGPLHNNNLRVIREGITTQDRIVINNFQKVRPDVPIDPVAAEIKTETSTEE